MSAVPMAQSTPDLAPSLASGAIPSKMEEFGDSEESPLQKQDVSDPPRLIPQNFVWRLGGRQSSSTDQTNVAGAMAVDVPVLRETFDPWNNGQHYEKEDGQGGRCRGCSKISKASTAVAQPPHAVPPSKWTALINSILSLFVRYPDVHGCSIFSPPNPDRTQPRCGPSRHDGTVIKVWPVHLHGALKSQVNVACAWGVDISVGCSPATSGP